MATTYLQITNELLRETNEVVLTSGNFASAIGRSGITYFIMGLYNNSARIIVRTIFMENIPNHIMGRVQTVLGVYTRAMVVLSSLYAGWAIEYHNISLATYFTFGHFMVALFGIFILQMLWKDEESIFLKVSHNA